MTSPLDNGAYMGRLELDIHTVVQLAVDSGLRVSNLSGMEPADNRSYRVDASSLQTLARKIARALDDKRSRAIKTGDADAAALEVAKRAYRTFLRIPDLPGGATQAISMMHCDVVDAMKARDENVIKKSQG